MNYYTTIKFNRFSDRVAIETIKDRLLYCTTNSKVILLRRADTIEYFINHPITKRVSNQILNNNINTDIVPYQNWKNDGLKNIPQQKLMKWSYYIYKI